ncbi:MAG: rRNA maturation RNase YbeY [Gammaproteobacteria bacterium]|nr:MAG: rRNA maturation RNase YbeY [Gammaproteobacteria bacterium]RLA35508.1 MAG: rRNA maturation RNase YbeY [Gammaproteobacteria bacterium]
MTAAVTVDVQIASSVESIPDEKSIHSWIDEAISNTGGTGGSSREISVRIVDEEEGRALNKQYREQDKATNVLSFPAVGAGESGLPPELSQSLGDIVICGPVVEREAAEQGKEVASHWAHLLVHGTLHLLAFDHETDADADAMEKLETKILATRGIADPYTVQS